MKPMNLTAVYCSRAYNKNQRQQLEEYHYIIKNQESEGINGSAPTVFDRSTTEELGG